MESVTWQNEIGQQSTSLGKSQANLWRIFAKKTAFPFQVFTTALNAMGCPRPMARSRAPRQDIVSILFPSKETEQYQLSILPFLTFPP